MRFDRLLTVPGELTRLTSLTALDVSHNQLEMLPSGLGSLFQLASLAANNNTLQVRKLLSLPKARSCQLPCGSSAAT